jgi:beta-lactamase family protein
MTERASTGDPGKRSGQRTRVMFVNHASILIKKGDRYLLTDPWHQHPAFGSWLPTFQQYVHPSYLAALQGKLSILVSHGHDDHCDDDLLSIFDKDTEIVTADFNAPSVLNRLKRIGFTNIKTAGRAGLTLSNDFIVKSYINPARSLDDASYSIDTQTGFVVHCNDNWFEFEGDILASIKSDRAGYANENVALFSQTNSASGYPLNYRIYDDKQKVSILRSKVKGMVIQGMKNADALGLDAFYSYAGFASVFVKDVPDYLELGLIPTGKFIRNELLDDSISQALAARVHVEDFYPGDVLDLSDGEMEKAFIASQDYTDTQLKDATVRYYHTYGIVDRCDTYQMIDAAFDKDRFSYFLENFNAFAGRKIGGGCRGCGGLQHDHGEVAGNRRGGHRRHRDCDIRH